MKNLIVAVLTLLGLALFSQNKVDVIIFSEDGDPFFAYVNGIKQNVTPETNIKMPDLSPNISLRLEFQNKAYPQIKQNYPLEPGFTHTFRIKKNTKNELKLRYFGKEPLSGAGNSTSSQNSQPIYNSESNSNDVAGGNSTNSSTTNYTTTTTSSSGMNNNQDVSMNVSVAGVGISMNVTGMGGADVGGMNTTSSSTVTTSTSSSGYNSSSSAVGTNNHPDKSTQSASANSKGGCTIAMNNSSFESMRSAVEAKPFSETKMSTAKIATKNACLSVNQIKTICKLFSMDEDKFTYAKYAYDYCTNKSEYYTVSDVFSFSATTDEFNKFLEGQ